MPSRPTPAFDRAHAELRKIASRARRHAWSPARVRLEFRRRRCACLRVWRRAVLAVFGALPRDIPDLRQLPLF